MKKNLISRIIKRIHWGPLILTAVIALLAGLAWGTVKAVDNPSFCGVCHSMQPYQSSWEKSSHKNVQCYSCHSEYQEANADTGQKKQRKFLITKNKVVIVFGKSVDYLREKTVDGVEQLKDKKDIFQMYFDILSGDTVDPWNACFKCHQNLIYNEETDHFGHSKHLQSGSLDCRQCHSNLIHGQQSKTSWQNCSECHQNNRIRPASHRSPSFESTHGRDYRSNKNCALCHPGGAQQKLCLDCHKTQVPHPANFKDRHIPTIAEVGIRNCMNCHENKLTNPPRRSTACEVCHGWEMPHEKNILRTHTSLVKAQGITSCSNCHQTSPEQKDMAVACISCHQVNMPHPPGFQRSHKSEVYTKGEGVCRYCHWPVNPVSPGAPWARPDFCLSCHMKNKPHKPGFKIQHQVEYYDPNRCAVCHPRVIHCSQCHVGE